jgi:glycerol-3-phosphate dehydrogenase
VKTATSGRTADLSRQHRVQVDDDGLVTISGGKLTTYREMAEDTVDTVIEQIGGRLNGRVSRRTRTKKLPLRGAAGYHEVHDTAGEAAGSTGLDPTTVVHLADRYGGEARTIVAMVEHDASLGERLHPAHPYLRAEPVYAARYEMATSVDDVLTRRVPLHLRDAAAAVAVADDVAALMAADLGWDEDQRAEQAEGFRSLVARERSASSLPPVGPEAVTS